MYILHMEYVFFLLLKLYFSRYFHETINTQKHLYNTQYIFVSAWITKVEFSSFPLLPSSTVGHSQTPLMSSYLK